MSEPKYFRIAAVMSTGMEQVTVDMPSWNPVTGEPEDISQDDMKEHVSYLLTVLDDRREQAHMRALVVYGMLQHIPDEHRTKIIEIVDCLTGKADPALVVQRWQAAAEETAELERMREEHRQQQQMQQHQQQESVNYGIPFPTDNGVQ